MGTDTVETRPAPPRGDSRERGLLPAEANQLLQARDYAELAALLARHQPSASNLSLTLLTTATQLCLAAAETTAEIDHLQSIHDSAVKRSQALHDNLSVLFEHLTQSPQLPQAMPHAPPQPPLRDRLGTLLQRLTHSQKLEGEQGGISAEGTLPSAQEPEILVQTLGTFCVYINNRLINDWKGNRSKQIFKYLLLNRHRPVSNDLLLDTFWPNDAPDAARRNLYQAVYLLRQVLQPAKSGHAYVISANGTYSLNPEIQIWLDCDLFEQHIQHAKHYERCGDISAEIKAYEQAETLYEGEFLSEDPFEEWLQTQRQQLHQFYLHALDRLCDYHEAQSNWTLCLTYAQKQLQADPCHEAAHCRIMQIYTRRGQRHLALRQYHLCAEQLQQELSVEPSPQTRALYDQLTSTE